MTDEINTDNLPENPEAEAIQPLSSSDAITGIFTEPCETFQTIAATHKKNYWLLPLIIMIVAGLISTFLFYRDSQLVDKIMDKQKEKVTQQMEEQVKNGKMSKEDAKVALERAEKFMDPKGIFFQAMGYISTVLLPVILGLLLSVVYLVALKIMKADFEYANILNAIGVPAVILAIGSIITIVLSILMGEISTLSPGLLLKEEMVGKMLNGFLVKLDVFTIWYFFIVSIGLSKIARIKSAAAYGIVFGVFIAYALITGLLFGAMG
jgi:hypothetical protein